MKGLKSDVLIEALKELVAAGESQADIHRKTGVYNVGRMLAGNHKATLETWLKLRSAYPSQIPEPEFKGGKTIHQIAKNYSAAVSQDGEGSVNVEMGTTLAQKPGRTVSAKEERFLQLWNRHKSDALLEAFTKRLEDIERTVSGGGVKKT